MEIRMKMEDVANARKCDNKKLPPHLKNLTEGDNLVLKSQEELREVGLSEEDAIFYLSGRGLITTSHTITAIEEGNDFIAQYTVNARLRQIVADAGYKGKELIDDEFLNIKRDYVKYKCEKIEVKNKTVLVVDDNKINLKVAERLLQTYGVLVECVESGFICIDNLKSGKKYDLILMDDMMPRMSGVETLQKIKVEIPEFDIPVISLTANALTGMREKYLADGFNDYLAKPINKDELNRVINEYLNKK